MTNGEPRTENGELKNREQRTEVAWRSITVIALDPLSTFGYPLFAGQRIALAGFVFEED